MTPVTSRTDSLNLLGRPFSLPQLFRGRTIAPIVVVISEDASGTLLMSADFGSFGTHKYDACRRQIYRPISKRNRRTTAQQVANQSLAGSGKQISRKTVARRLKGGGLYARRPVVRVPFTRQHRTARLQWCREHHNWNEQD
ncbi:hypothetical protein TNCV_3402831 [Trichonephila clavipes]|nr:hypothetical protein TNCV_3402831 [Trichonephila clavipes]